MNTIEYKVCAWQDIDDNIVTAALIMFNFFDNLFNLLLQNV
jgi:hypothetical protein